MPTNQFLPFATAGGAFVLSNAAYAGLAARLSGYLPGLLTKEALNSAVRQGSFVAAALSQAVAEDSGDNILDDGNIANWVASFRKAIRALVAQQGGYWCGVATGTAAAQVVATPTALVAFPTGTAVAWQVSAGPNPGAVTLQVGAFGTFPLRRDGPAGPVALTGGELQVDSIVMARFDGVNLQLVDSAMGTAALADASSATGTVAAVSGATIVGNLAKYSDVKGTLVDGGPIPSSALPILVNASQAIVPGTYYVDTSGGPITLTLPAALGSSVFTFVDSENTWGTNNLTIDGNGHNIGNVSTNVSATFPADVSDCEFSIMSNTTYWRLV